MQAFFKITMENRNSVVYSDKSSSVAFYIEPLGCNEGYAIYKSSPQILKGDAEDIEQIFSRVISFMQSNFRTIEIDN
jgi:hypothetical protein